MQKRVVLIVAGLLVPLMLLLAGCQPATGGTPVALKEVKITLAASSFTEVAPPQAQAPGGLVKLTFKIDNPNDVDVRLQYLQYTLRGTAAGQPLPVPVSPSPAQLFVVDSVVPKNGSITVDDTVTITKAGPFVPLWPQIQKVDKWAAAGVALVVKEGLAYPFVASQ